jgi:hypothetical protein
MTPLAPHITAFLRERLPVDRRASEHTVSFRQGCVRPLESGFLVGY